MGRASGVGRRVAICLALGLLPCLAGAKSQTVASVESPGKVLKVELSLDDGRLAYRVLRLGEPVIDDSRLGFLLREGGRLERNLTLVSQSTRSADETWEQPWGESRLVRNRYTELTARIAERGRFTRRFDVVFRLYDDGIGFR